MVSREGNVDCLMIEVTRRCNLRCKHCMRGEPQQLDFEPVYLETFLVSNGIRHINRLVFAGGEPSLVPEIISECVTILNNLHIYVVSWFIATNGTFISLDKSKAFLHSVLDLHILCRGSCGSVLAISNTRFHREARKTVGKQKLHNEWQSMLLRSFPFAEMRTDSFLLDKGRAKALNEKKIADPLKADVVYLNCKGQVLPDGSMAYDEQDEIAICTVEQPINRYNEKSTIK